jgi:hypothetical protein
MPAMQQYRDPGQCLQSAQTASDAFDGAVATFANPIAGSGFGV